jgi:glycosyltransferase involved in cell wall biosynthesis
MRNIDYIYEYTGEENKKAKLANKKYLVSIVCPAYNEEAIIEKNIRLIRDCLEVNLDKKFEWEILIINDGSKDKTGEIAEKLVVEDKRIRVIHHMINLNLGIALKSGFYYAKGDYIIVLDIDLSYDTCHINDLLDKIHSTKADIVVASPYMKGGKVTNVPFTRKILSKWVNRFMRMAAQEKYYTFTGMVRAYKSSFIKKLNLKTKDYEINPEVMYKAMILRAQIIEIPAHLDWSLQNKAGKNRKSSIKVAKGILSGLMSAFIFRPYVFYMGMGISLLLISIYIIVWIFINTFNYYPEIQIDPQFIDDRFSLAIGHVFDERPHAFFVGGIILIAAIQFLSMGFLSLQNKRYFEEIFHITTNILGAGNTNDKD